MFYTEIENIYEDNLPGARKGQTLNWELKAYNVIYLFLDVGWVLNKIENAMRSKVKVKMI